jgi:hypothetical protein
MCLSARVQVEQLIEQRAQALSVVAVREPIGFARRPMTYRSRARRK